MQRHPVLSGKNARPKTGPCHLGNVRIGIAKDRHPHVSQSYDVLRQLNPDLLDHFMTDIRVDDCRVGIRSVFHQGWYAEHMLIVMINPRRNPHQSNGVAPVDKRDVSCKSHMRDFMWSLMQFDHIALRHV